MARFLQLYLLTKKSLLLFCYTNHIFALLKIRKNIIKTTFKLLFSLQKSFIIRENLLKFVINKVIYLDYIKNVLIKSTIYQYLFF